MRGLPYRATEDEIRDFFAPVRLLGVQILLNKGTARNLPVSKKKGIFELKIDDRPSGKADVAFYSHEDASASMSKNRQHLGGVLKLGHFLIRIRFSIR